MGRLIQNARKRIDKVFHSERISIIPLDFCPVIYKNTSLYASNPFHLRFTARSVVKNELYTVPMFIPNQKTRKCRHAQAIPRYMNNTVLMFDFLILDGFTVLLFFITLP